MAAGGGSSGSLAVAEALQQQGPRPARVTWSRTEAVAPLGTEGPPRAPGPSEVWKESEAAAKPPHLRAEQRISRHVHCRALGLGSEVLNWAAVS